MGYEIIDLIIDSSVEMTISDIGTAKVNAPVKKERKAEHTALENALKAVGNNYTLIVKEEIHETNLLNYVESDNYYESHFYFADEYLLVFYIILNNPYNYIIVMFSSIHKHLYYHNDYFMFDYNLF